MPRPKKNYQNEPIQQTQSADMISDIYVVIRRKGHSIDVVGAFHSLCSAYQLFCKLNVGKPKYVYKSDLVCSDLYCIERTKLL